ncbi:hypothetical protein EN814_09775 [Mesorhizobium sp. M2D.F.Ca.ET.171.01.1.1]|uniref:hypothetical protein n=1 Tax=unclassified Mesorhizobium TaxID=325217 RepID=UPI001092AECE|nr:MULTISPECIES: hypothetical protein [unclassified Mesorhizobium]TGS97472.1 hypothetical protein EN821_09770 [Mesorhizobium sp. M2D.F.Ca.ET.178.01.1.1]TGT12043.1 hypothetical protein EN814_09775 [Mesorhizobium sp. M2D.F.Ca.ET.171.01.1.1]
MAFRADEAAADGYERLRNYLISRNLPPSERARSEEVLRKIVDEYGPAVDGYPSWHPLIRNHDGQNPETYPNERCGYDGLDHTVLLAHAFITCPYAPSEKAEKVLSSANRLPYHHAASIEAESLDVAFYNTGTTAILVRCNWSQPLEIGRTIPKSLAVPLMLEQELPCWTWSQRAETWETMRPYLLGEPHGQRSSLFVSQETALAMKKIYLAMVESGMFGPLKTR